MRRGLVGLFLFAASAWACASSPAALELAPKRDVERATIRAEQRVAARATRGVRVILPEVVVHPAAHPLDGLSRAEIDRLLRTSPERLGSASVGQPHRGSLLNGVQLEPSPLWHAVRPERSWGTSQTIAALTRAIEAVHRRFPGTPALQIGDLSRERGGYFRPHRSHQSGRDADVGYYYLEGPAWYRRASAENLDVERTWALVEAFVSGGDVEYLFIDRSVQALLRAHAEATGEDPNWLESVFGNRRTSIVRHAWGHQTHLHIRFHDQRAERTGRLTEQSLRRLGRRI
jgi:murein endopeptidase